MSQNCDLLDLALADWSAKPAQLNRKTGKLDLFLPFMFEAV